MLYTPEELVRIELLRYPITSEQLHPIEYSWRCLAKKLLEHAERLQGLCISHHNNSYWKYGKNDDCPVCKENLSIILIKFPEAYSPIQKNEKEIKIS